MYPDSDAPIIILDELPPAADVPPSSLVVVGHAHGLSDDSISEFTRLAVAMGSEHTLRRTMNLLGNTAAVSFCHRCATEP